jgi:adenosylcobyric acid synthase
MGRTELPADTAPFALLSDGEPDGAVSCDGRVVGTYCHGLLASGPLRRALLEPLGARIQGADYHQGVEAALDDLAGELEHHLDVEGLVALARGHSA